MISLYSFLTFTHIIGISLAVGAATAKLTLLFKCNSDDSFVSSYLQVSRPITKIIIIGQTLVTLSGIGWLFYGYGFTTLLIIKIVLVAAVWVLGPYMDNAVEPKFRALAPVVGQSATPEFKKIRKRLLGLEVLATLIYYTIIVIWVLI
jgi:hypothetical protein